MHLGKSFLVVIFEGSRVDIEMVSEGEIGIVV